MVAYNYEKQIWVEGPEAKTLLISQAKQQLELLQSAKGDEYAKAMGKSKETMISTIRQSLTNLEK